MRKYCSLIIFIFVLVVSQYVYSNDRQIPDNPEYKEWCEETFKDGKYIYEGYKDIAFNIKYTPESAKTDFWQTPFETRKSKKGDCEEAVFLFWTHLPSKMENAEIVWGWVVDKKTEVAKAHVWYQLIDKKSQLHIVEGFSNEWNGIIPMRFIRITEKRIPILTISHSELSNLYKLVSGANSIESYQEFADLHKFKDSIESVTGNKNTSIYATKLNFMLKNRKMSLTFNPRWGLSKEDINAILDKNIQSIYTKLHRMFTRYDLELKKEKENRNWTLIKKRTLSR